MRRTHVERWQLITSQQSACDTRERLEKQMGCSDRTAPHAPHGQQVSGASLGEDLLAVPFAPGFHSQRRAP